MKKGNPSLLFCVLMDVMGYVSFTIPFIGEFSDVVWAPLSAFVFYKTFGGRKGVWGGVFNFVEELLPFTDFIPTFTITWLLQRKKQVKPGKGLQLSKLA